MSMRHRPLNPELHHNPNPPHGRFTGVSRRRLRLGLRNTAAVCLLLHPASSLFAETITLNPSADTALHEYFPENNLGAQAWLTAGTTQNGPRTRGLMRFDFTGLIPAGAIVNSVTLTLEVTRTPIDGDAPSSFLLHRMLVGWGEGTGSGTPPLLGRAALPGEANWTYRFAGSAPWAAPGGLAGVDYAAARSGEQFVYGENFSPYTFASTGGLVADAQRWLDHPDQNFGWMLLTQDETANFSARRFASREDPFRAPLLEIDFTPVPEPSTWALLALAGGAAWWRRRR